jgi:hypothetical protein
LFVQVFKLKGADRKHKQDRDKIQKRPPSEQEKFAKPYDKTVLIDLAPGAGGRSNSFVRRRRSG